MKRVVMMLLSFCLLAAPVSAAEEIPSKPDTIDELWEMYLELWDKYNELTGTESTGNAYEPWTYSDELVTFLVPDPVIFVEKNPASYYGGVEYVFHYCDTDDYSHSLSIIVGDSSNDNLRQRIDSLAGRESDNGVYSNELDDMTTFLRYEEGSEVSALVVFIAANDNPNNEIYWEIFDSVTLSDPSLSDLTKATGGGTTYISGMRFDAPEVVAAAKYAIDAVAAWKQFELSTDQARNKIQDARKRVESVDIGAVVSLSSLASSLILGDVDEALGKVEYIVTCNPDDGDIRLQYRR